MSWIQPKRDPTNTRMWGTTSLPTCPVCGMIGATPGTPIVVSSGPAGDVRGETLANVVLFICTGCSVLFAGFTTDAAE